MNKSNLVVKTNRLNSVVQNLSLAEIRLIQLAIVDARETGEGLSADKPLTVSALRFSEVFNLSVENAYTRLKEAEDTLFNRRFSFTDKDGDVVKSRWVQRVKYKAHQGAIELIFTYDVVKEISRIDGAEQFFTKYAIENTNNFKSNYSIRLYELLVQWKTAKKTPLMALETFRGQLGLEGKEYKAMGDFKKRVLEVAVKEINEKSDLQVSYEQEKKGRSIIGFKFTVFVKEKSKAKNLNRDVDTPDFFHGMTEKQQALFASKLAHDDTFSSRTFIAPVGADMPSYIFSIKQKLASTEFQKKWAKDLAKVGYNPKY